MPAVMVSGLGLGVDFNLNDVLKIYKFLYKRVAFYHEVGTNFHDFGSGAKIV